MAFSLLEYPDSKKTFSRKLIPNIYLLVVETDERLCIWVVKYTSYLARVLGVFADIGGAKINCVFTIQLFLKHIERILNLGLLNAN